VSDDVLSPDWTAFDRLEAGVRNAHLALRNAREVFGREPRECVIMRHSIGGRVAAEGPEHFVDLWRQGWRPE